MKWPTPFFALITFVFVGCGSDTEKVLLTGSSTVAPVIAEIAQLYEKTNPNVEVDVQTGGSTRGIIDAMKQHADIGMVSRELSEEEKQNLTQYTLAYDGIALVLHRDNKVNALSSEQAKQIYLGEIDNWEQVGGEDSPIVVVHKAEGRSTNELFIKHLDIKNQLVQADVIIGDNQQGLKAIAANKGAIGYVSVGAAQYDVAIGQPIKLITLNDVPATLDTVRSGEFPLTRQLNLVVKGEQSVEAQKFIGFALSDEVSPIIASHYLVPADAKN